MSYHRNLKENMRELVDEILPKLAYGIAYYGFRNADLGTWLESWHSTGDFGHHIHHEAERKCRNHWHGDVANYSAPFSKTTGEKDGTAAFYYRPKLHKTKDASNKPVDPFICFYNFGMEEIKSFEVLPAQATPKGPPSVTEYRLKNDRPEPAKEEFEIEDTQEKQEENSFGWLVGTEFEENTRISGGVAVSAELSVTLRQRLEAHGDKRWQQTVNHRELLRGDHKVGPYGVLIAKITEQLTEMSQYVNVNGLLTCSVQVQGSSSWPGNVTWVSLDDLLDSLRGFGGANRYAEWFGQDGHGVKEDNIANHIIPFVPHTRLELGPKDERTLLKDKDLHEEAYPGRQEEYDAAKSGSGGDSFDDDFDL